MSKLILKKMDREHSREYRPFRIASRNLRPYEI